MRSLIGTTLAVGAAFAGLWACGGAKQPSVNDSGSEAFEHLPLEEPYAYHKVLREGPVHRPRRDPAATASADEVDLSSGEWKLLAAGGEDGPLGTAARDFGDYLTTSMQAPAAVEFRSSLGDWSAAEGAVVVGTRQTLPGCGAELEGSKDYALDFSDQRLVICGYDELGAAQGLYHLEARMNLREAPFLEKGKTVRKSLYQKRMVLNNMGWMEWPDNYLSLIAHAGFDGIYASIYANPNGAEGTAHYTKIRKQKPEDIHDLLERASRYGISVYAPVLFRYTGTRESEQELRTLMRDILGQFPQIKGYVLLTEGFFYDEWFGAGGHGGADLRDWARKWARAVEIVVEESHRVDPGIEVLPWEYNIDFRPTQVDLKRYFIQQLPEDSIPLVTWENGKSFELGGFQGFLIDYSISQAGPAEVSEAQIAEAHRRGMKIYTKGDTFASWQFGTLPYLPVPYQFQQRYDAMAEHGVDGVLESWSFGYSPNFISELRAWTCWTGAPPFEELMRLTARRDFGAGSEELVLEAWKRFSAAIRLLPDMGPSMGTNFSPGVPLFFQKPPARTMTLEHSWSDQSRWKTYRGAGIDPLWPFAPVYLNFIPDFSNQVNMAEAYARRRTGISRLVKAEELETLSVLPLYQQRMLEMAQELEAGLGPYREAARKAPEAKKPIAWREVMLAEQILRTVQSTRAVLAFEDLRFRLAHASDNAERGPMLDEMEGLLAEEIARTKQSLEAVRRDSRLGYEFETDYVYNAYVLEEKLEVMQTALDEEIPAYREQHGL